ncbi:hypothetical protein A2U01_0027718 [Trifolium medium]|uniref:Uncharacterized protein n=1 Tax=Trifolium medium TaxID=97028 RepID=A0A392P3S0_9FABA|nr:hypothetical protein [Trifolium medium]
MGIRYIHRHVFLDCSCPIANVIKIGDNTLCRASSEAIFSLSRALGKTVLSGWKTNIACI